MQNKLKKKKLSIDEIKDSADPIIAENNRVGEKTPLKFKKNDKKKKIKHLKLYVILAIAAVVLTLLTWFGFSIYNSMSNIFGENAPGLLSLLSSKQLKGESSGRVNVLLLGVGDPGHAGETLTDTIMVLSYDVASHQVAMISIPRDLYVNLGRDCGYGKINSSHSCGENRAINDGPIYASEAVSKVLDIPIHYYARVNFSGFKDVVDAVGGVDVYVQEDLYDYLYPTDDGGITTLYIKKGMQHMNGETALMYSRSRETTSDFDRARRQQEVLVAIKNKVMSTETFLSPQKIASLADALGKNIKTDFDLSYAQRAIDLFTKVDTSAIKNLVFDNSEEGLLTDDSDEYAGYILVPRAGLYNYKEMQLAVKNIFQSSDSIKDENAKISIKNGTSVGGLAGRVAEDLRSQGYNVINVSSADSQSYMTTTITKNGDGFPLTITSLEEYFSVSSKTGSVDSGSDITIIIGSDFKE